MLLNGVNHVAIVTKDADGLVAFYREVFEAEVAGRQGFAGFWLTFIRIGETAELNVFQIDGNTEADRQTPMFGRGRIDHVGLQAASMDAYNPPGTPAAFRPAGTEGHQGARVSRLHPCADQGRSCGVPEPGGARDRHLAARRSEAPHVGVDRLPRLPGAQLADTASRALAALGSHALGDVPSGRADAAAQPARLGVGEQMTAATSRRYQHVRTITFT